MKSGYLYVLVHPSDPDLYKIGVTTLQPESRLAQHNSRHDEYAGRIVQETGQKWALKTSIPVPDTYWAKSVFWSATGLADIPYRGGVEVQRMDWPSVQAGLDAAQRMLVRPPQRLPDHVYANGAWMNGRLQGRGITLVGHVRSKFGAADFQCRSGHRWRAVPNDVAQGEGCPVCGTGKVGPEALRGPARLCLWVHPGKPGLIKIGLTYGTEEQRHEDSDRDGWEVHRYRHVEEPALAEALVWELLESRAPTDREPIIMDLGKAEAAFRELIPRLHRELALVEKRRQDIGQAS